MLPLSQLLPTEPEMAVADTHTENQGVGTQPQQEFPAMWNASPDAVDLVANIHAETDTPLEEIELLHQQGLLHKIPRDDEGHLTSTGSIEHFAGTCKACVFWFRMSCIKGLNCPYCHLVHSGQKQKRIRPSKSTRLKRRAEAGGLDGALPENAAEPDEPAWQ